MTTRRGEDPSGRRLSAPRVASEPRGTADRSEPMLRPSEVARLLACSSKTVYAWAASGSLPCVRLGRLVRFRAVDVRRFVEQGGRHPQLSPSSTKSPLSRATRLTRSPRSSTGTTSQWVAPPDVRRKRKNARAPATLGPVEGQRVSARRPRIHRRPNRGLRAITRPSSSVTSTATGAPTLVERSVLLAFDPCK